MPRGRLPIPMLIGQRFGRLVITAPGPKRESGEARWCCRCDCGQERLVGGTSLRKGHTVSCGCFGRERVSIAKTTHGQTRGKRSPLYRLWMQMRVRCKRPGYLILGVRICARWDSFELFAADMVKLGPKPSPHHSLDRKNNNGHYEPSNVRWATPSEQHRNKRNNRLLTFHDQTMCLAAWAERTKIPYSTLQMRLNVGWSIAKALSQPLKPQRSPQNRVQSRTTKE